MRPVSPIMALVAAALVIALYSHSGALAWDPHQSPPTVPRDIQDWLTPESRKELPELPEDGSVQLENPPVFGWKSNRFRYSFEVRIDRNGEQFLNFVTQDNLFRPDEPLPPGDYQWQVRQLDHVGRPRNAETNGGWSQPRRFSVRETSYLLRVPDLWTAYAAAEGGKRPRSVPADRQRLSAEQASLFDLVRRRFDKEAAGAVDFADLRRQLSGADDSILQSRKVRGHMRQMMRRINDALTVFLLHPDRRERARAARVGVTYLTGIVSVDAFGRTGHSGDDLLNIRVAKTVARAFDILYREMDGGLRTEVRRHVEFRTQAAFDFFLLNDRGNLSQFALSSHGFQIATHVLAIAALMAGDSDRAVLWFRETYPLVSTIVTPWGGDDGGYSNGINYGVWEFVNHVDSWDIIQNVVGFRYFDTAWVRNFIKFLAYVVPPGVSYAGFGDGGEKLREDLWSGIARLYVERGRRNFASTLDGRGQSDQGDESDGDIANALLWPRLFVPKESPGDTLSADMPGAAIFPDIGWGIIHSDTADPARYSILFKSSQFGSFSHSHADQNSFFIMGAGRPLLIDSGYYDGYRSPHHNGWTRQTRAHNAITYDGGKGQPIDDPGAVGRLTDYWRCGGVVKLTGQAAKAYGDGITSAERTLIRLPDGVVLIHDHMEAETPRRWEWNFHSAVPIRSDGETTAFVRNGPGELELSMLKGPEVRLSLRSGFEDKPNEKQMGSAPDQHHGAFVADEKSRILSMLTAIRLGGNAAAASAKRDVGGRFEFTSGGYSGVIGPGELHLLENGRPVAGEGCEVPPRVSTAVNRLRIGNR